MRYFFFYCLFSLFIVFGLRAYPALPTGVETVDSLLTQASEELADVNPVKALELATEALSLSRDADYSKGRAMSFFYIGQILSYGRDYEKSLEYLSLSGEERYSKNNPIMESEICRIRGRVYYSLKMDKASLQELQKAYTLTTQIKDKVERERYTSLAYDNLSMAYHVIKDMPDSNIYWLRKNEELLLTTDENLTFRNKINLYSLYGNHYTRQQQYDTARIYFEQAEALLQKYDYPYSSWLYQRWGDLYVDKANLDSALILYRKGLDNLMVTSLRNELPGLYKRVADIYTKQGNEDSARLYREKHLQISAELREARISGAEEAFAMLIREEKKMSLQQMRRTISLVLLFSAIGMTSFILIISQFIKKKKKKESQVSELERKLNSAFEEIIELAKSNDTAFLPRFREVYPEFSNGLIKRHPDLTNSELRLASMIFLSFSSKEIADYMFMMHRSVQTSKSRLRKKLGIATEIDLYQYIKSI